MGPKKPRSEPLRRSSRRNGGADQSLAEMLTSDEQRKGPSRRSRRLNKGGGANLLADASTSNQIVEGLSSPAEIECKAEAQSEVQGIQGTSNDQVNEAQEAVSQVNKREDLEGPFQIMQIYSGSGNVAEYGLRMQKSNDVMNVTTVAMNQEKVNRHLPKITVRGQKPRSGIRITRKRIVIQSHWSPDQRKEDSYEAYKQAVPIPCLSNDLLP